MLQTIATVGRFAILGEDVSSVELRGLEPLTPCLQSDVFAGSGGADLAGRLPVSSREIPLLTPANATLMSRRS